MLRTLKIFLALLPALAAAQSIHGTVTDADHKPLAKAAVQLTDRQTARTRTAATTLQGDFTLSPVPPGDYRLEVHLDNYRPSTLDLTVSVSQEYTLTIPLLPASRTDVIHVTATVAALGGLIANRQIVNLPLDGRNFYELGLLLPGVVPPAPGSAGSVRGDFAVNINGAREDSNQFSLDGIFNGDPKLNGIAIAPPVDAVREFDLASGAFDASLGRNSGGQFNVVLKSGGNNFHGTVWEFLRNRSLDARNFFAADTEKYNRNQFGASAGGPVRRNQTFFFVDYEAARLREGITRVTNVPTAAERSGAAFGIPKSYLNPIGVAIANLYPLPNRNAAGQNFVSSPTQTDRNDQFDIRLDHNLRPSDDLSVRYSFADRSLYEPFTGPSYAQIPGFGDNVPRRAQNAMASETHTFSPNLLNELRLGVNRISAGVYQQNATNNLNAQVGLPTTNARDTGLSLINVTGYSPIGDEYNNPQHSASTLYQLTDTLTYIRGRHLIKTGVDLRYLGQNAYRDVLGRGYLSFLGFSGSAVAELLTGFPTVTGRAQIDNAQHLRTHSVYGFLQDTWRVTPNLTFTTGLRYEFNSPPVDASDRANVYANRSLVRVGTNGIPRGGYNPDRNNLAPRLGIAWRNLLRVGYGIYYDQSSLATGEGLYFNAPYYVSSLYYSFQQFPLSLSDPFPRNYPLFIPSTALAFQRDLRTAYTQQWNVSIRRYDAELAYAGSKGSKLIGARDLNQPAPNNPRPNQQFDDINIIESRANSSYHALQARYQKKFLLASYTWSKSIDDASSFFTSAGDPNYPQDSRHVNLERALSSYDVRHRLTLSYTANLPWGFNTSGVWAFQTGRPFTVALNPDLDNSNTGRSTLGFGANDRPHVLRNPSLPNPSPDRWFDATAFALPQYGTFGSAGRNILTGPGTESVNLTLTRKFKLSEGAQILARAESFNTLNHTNFDLPGIFLGTPNFGKIQSAQPPRRLQLGLKLTF